jgi:hypothetical protein
MEVSGQLHAPVALFSGRSIGTQWIKCCVGSRAGLEKVEKSKFLTLPGLELQPLCHIACSQPLYQMRNADSSL